MSFYVLNLWAAKFNGIRRHMSSLAYLTAYSLSRRILI